MYAKADFIRIVATTSPYDSNDFPEATHYVDFVCEKIVAMHPDADVDVTNSYHTRTFVDWIDAVSGEHNRHLEGKLERDIEALINNEWWEEFCTEGYKAYANESPEDKIA